jgi:hypothetical protein
MYYVLCMEMHYNPDGKLSVTEMALNRDLCLLIKQLPDKNGALFRLLSHKKG